MVLAQRGTPEGRSERAGQKRKFNARDADLLLRIGEKYAAGWDDSG
jgi:hypothetical protein